MNHNSIILIGMAGVGKSTIGKLLARNLKFEFVDLDEIIEKNFGYSPTKIIDLYGEEAFSEMERKAAFLLDTKNRVVSPGGSIVYSQYVMQHLKKLSTIIYLSDTFENIEARLKERKELSIIGMKKNKSIKEIFDERQPLYSKYADKTINVSGKNQKEVVKEILDYIKLG